MSELLRLSSPWLNRHNAATDDVLREQAVADAEAGCGGAWRFPVSPDCLVTVTEHDGGATAECVRCLWLFTSEDVQAVLDVAHHHGPVDDEARTT